MVYRIYVEKKRLFAVDGGATLADLNTALGIKSVKNVRIINRYDVEGLSEENFKKAVPTVFSEPPVDDVYFDLPSVGEENVCLRLSFCRDSSTREPIPRRNVFRCCARATAPM